MRDLGSGSGEPLSRGQMPGEFYFIAFGGLGVSFAGFAGLISALDRGPAAQSVVVPVSRQGRFGT